MTMQICTRCDTPVNTLNENRCPRCRKESSTQDIIISPDWNCLIGFSQCRFTPSICCDRHEECTGQKESQAPARSEQECPICHNLTHEDVTQLTALKAERDSLRDALIIFDDLMSHADFKNGIESQGTDQGEHMAHELYKEKLEVIVNEARGELKEKSKQAPESQNT